MNKKEVRFNYSYLRGFVKDNPKLGSDNAFASFLGITTQELNYKYKSAHQFTCKQIAKVKLAFNLSDEQVCLYFFNV